MTDSRPHIAVTGPDKGFKAGWWASRFILRGLGARPHYISPANPQLERPVDAVIIGGGSDIQPDHYKGDPILGYPYDPARDAFEIAVVEQALAKRLPLLGICRGAQLLNVVKGGNLLGDVRPLRKHTSNRNFITPSKSVRLSLGSRLAKLTQRQQLKVNSLHKQAIATPGEGLQIVARDKDDLVQAVEAPEGFVMGVQWHPEYLPYKKPQRELFRGLCKAASNNSQQATLSVEKRRIIFS
ncbi:type 1 glutamine amidotransferase [Simiduia sp. 21SJ11W-1]|uniref:gamma-glutamyl-gamma-aminobutyrate hydrolase family protein n=1 Tax=Simiduia sp. 21SJ11W-1 TaxID=2909669 RepID=UPI00209D4C99|nr:type 1 glutamine amidotransferase [Simiduia sp. 21SJ11W-1]UTA47306.1 type 1 glutamine amidotransferase [Simiduia sp. 21SJ11W-1]